MVIEFHGDPDVTFNLVTLLTYFNKSACEEKR